MSELTEKATIDSAGLPSEQTWTPRAERNVFVGYCNNWSLPFETMAQQFERVTGGIFVPGNLAEHYRNSVFKISEGLEKKGIDYFDHTSPVHSLRRAVETRLTLKIERGVQIAQIITEMLQRLEPFFTIPGTDIVFERMSRKLIEEYKEISNFISGYSLESDLRETLLVNYCDTRYHILVPGSYRKMFENDKKALTELGLYQQFAEIEEELSSIVQAQEIMSEKAAATQQDINTRAREQESLHDLLNQVTTSIDASAPNLEGPLIDIDALLEGQQRGSDGSHSPGKK